MRVAVNILLFVAGFSVSLPDQSNAEPSAAVKAWLRSQGIVYGSVPTPLPGASNSLLESLSENQADVTFEPLTGDRPIELVEPFAFSKVNRSLYVSDSLGKILQVPDDANSISDLSAICITWIPPTCRSITAP